MIARSCIAMAALIAASSPFAQTPPSWNAPGAGSLSKPSTAVSTRVATSPAAVAATVGAAPHDRDCKTQVTRPDAPYGPVMTRWSSDGTEDHGQILNFVGGATHILQGNLDDVQVRIEQLRCEQLNIKAKLDYLIRALVA